MLLTVLQDLTKERFSAIIEGSFFSDASIDISASWFVIIDADVLGRGDLLTSVSLDY